MQELNLNLVLTQIVGLDVIEVQRPLELALKKKSLSKDPKSLIELKF
jgi:hypothetical protein